MARPSIAETKLETIRAQILADIKGVQDDILASETKIEATRNDIEASKAELYGLKRALGYIEDGAKTESAPLHGMADPHLGESA